MNALRRDIPEGSRIRLITEEGWSLSGKECTAVGGFGMRASTIGSAVFINTDDGEKYRVEGYDVAELIREGPEDNG